MKARAQRADFQRARDVEPFRRTAATPNAVLISIGHSEQMKITKIADRPRVLDGVERERHPGQRRDRLQHLDEGIERPVDQAATCRSGSRAGSRPATARKIAGQHARERIARAGCRCPCRSGRCRRTGSCRCSHSFAPTSSGPGIADLPWRRGRAHQLGVFGHRVCGQREAGRRQRGEMPRDQQEAATERERDARRAPGQR